MSAYLDRPDRLHRQHRDLAPQPGGGGRGGRPPGTGRRPAGRRRRGDPVELAVASMFIFIGAEPRTDWLDGRRRSGSPGLRPHRRGRPGAGARTRAGRSGTATCWRPAFPVSSPSAMSGRRRSSGSPPPSARGRSPSSSCTSTCRCRRPGMTEPMVGSIEELIAAMPMFEQLDAGQRSWLAERAELRDLPAGVELVVEDGPPSGFWFLVEGEIEVRRRIGGVDVRVGSGDQLGAWVGAIPYVHDTSLMTGRAGPRQPAAPGRRRGGRPTCSTTASPSPPTSCGASAPAPSASAPGWPNGSGWPPSAGCRPAWPTSSTTRRRPPGGPSSRPGPWCRWWSGRRWP